MDELRKLKTENEFLKQQIESICKEFYNFFEDKPDDSGMYLHLGICSGDRHKPIGTCGCVCKNAAVFARSKNPHDWVLIKQSRIPERGLNWDKYECSKCNWTRIVYPDRSIEELNNDGWCPIYDS